MAGVAAGLHWLVVAGDERRRGRRTWDWTTASPESQGMSAARLESAWAELKDRRTTALLVIRNDRIVFERYAAGFDRHKPHYTASMAKALVGGMGLMLAMDDGRISPDDLASRYVARWRDDPMRQAITIRHLATHTSGIEDAEENDLPHDRLTGWKGDFWKRLDPPRDPYTLAASVAPVLDKPGTKERYSNPGMAMLGYCLASCLKGAADADLRSLLKHRIMEPLGVPDARVVGGLRQDDDRRRPAGGGDLGRRSVQPQRRGQGRPAAPAPGEMGGPATALRGGRQPGAQAQRPAGAFGAGLVGEHALGRKAALEVRTR